MINVSQDVKRFYENIDPTKEEATYENVETSTNTKEEVVYENSSHYENYPNIELTKPQVNIEEDYENYDFGENGIYQNILFSECDSHLKSMDIQTEVQTLRKSVNEVNEILQQNKSLRKDESLPKKLFQSKLDICLQLPTKITEKVEKQKQKEDNVDSLSQSNTYHDSNKKMSSENIETHRKENPSKLKKKPNYSIFRNWALNSKAEQTKVDLSKLTTSPSLEEKPNSTFTLIEKEIVAKFLEDVKSEMNSLD